MPRCYMVKKALCNKYINSVARGFESRGRGRSTPSPTNVQPVSLKANPSPVALEEKQAEEGAVSLISSECPSEFSSDLSLKNRLQKVQDLLEESSDEPTLLVVKPSSLIQRDHDIQQKLIAQPTEKLVEKASPTNKCTIIAINTFPHGQFPIIRKVKDIAKDQSKLTLVENSPLILVEKPALNRFHKVQDVIENAIQECTETLVEKFPPIQLQKQNLQENVIYKCLDSSDKFPSRRLKKVQDVIEDVIEQCTPLPTVTTATTTVITRSGTTTTTILQPPEFRPQTSPPPPRLEEPLIRLESTSQIKVNDDLRPRQSSPPSSTEGCTSRLEMLAPFRNSPSLSERFSSSSRSVIVSSDDYQSTNDGMQLFRDRSAAETEAAHDLLELSRSLPPLPQPGVAIGPQNVVEAPATDVQEMRVYQRETPVYQVNTIFASDLLNSGIYQHHQGEIIYEPTANARTIVQQAPGGVFIPLSPVQEILFTYATPSVSSMIAEQSIGSRQSIGPGQSMIIDQSIASPSSSIIGDQSIGSAIPSRIGQTIASITPSMIVDQSLRPGTPSISGSVTSTMIIDQSVGAGSSRIEGQSVGASRSSMMAGQSLSSGTSSISGTSTIVGQLVGAGMSSTGSATSSMRAGQSTRSGTPSITGASMITEQSVGAGMSSGGSAVTSSMRAGFSIRSETSSISGSSMTVEQSSRSVAPSSGPVKSMLVRQSPRSGTSSISGSSMIVEQSLESVVPATGSETSSMFVRQSMRSGTPSISGSSMIVEESIGSVTPSRIVRQSVESITSSMFADKSVGSATPLDMDDQLIGSVTPSRIVRQSIGSMTSRILNQSAISVRSSVTLEQSVGPMTPTSMVDQSIGDVPPSRIVEQTIGTVLTSTVLDQPMETVPPLTPPISECSSDIENNNPNWQANLKNQEVQTITEQTESKVAAYTYDTLLVTDGRSKNKKGPLQQKDTPEVEPVDNIEVPKAGRYVCSECGKQYATSSNLSRHKQTHRSIDSQSAKKCVYCGKAYVSMPALAMHVLTHKLTHSCGICGKMFSRPWLLQGHLRSHTGEKPYGCAHCGKAFADRSNLRAHMQTHSSDKNYECPKCGKSFALKSYLNKHLESACQRENGDDSSNDVDSVVTL